MSRIANNPVPVPNGVEVTIDGPDLNVKGAKGALQLTLHSLVTIAREDDLLLLKAVGPTQQATALAGTFRSLISNMVQGVSEGFQKQLELQGVGYRAQSQGAKLNLTLGFSHPVVYDVPEGIEIETPTQTQIIVRGVDKQKVGQVSAEIRAFRPPEPYKGKGVRYANEYVKRKEAKKK
ncbi:MAG: 50S ribosomal protein L6 [Pseudomonadales bacterium]|jgi:large subunit ribosomal protein L6|tara:strand:- start:146 stop:679 length:534 start_codon:yes stop_codon:yes gene_type:complete